jgi:hypothetical protein
MFSDVEKLSNLNLATMAKLKLSPGAEKIG